MRNVKYTYVLILFNVSCDHVSGFLKGSTLSMVKYRHPLASRLCPCISGSHVKMTKGTGLVHTAPAHGHDDFLVALEHKLPLVSVRGCGLFFIFGKL